MNFTDSKGQSVELPPNTDVSRRIGAYAVVRNDGRYLMVQNSSGLWHFPGGAIEGPERAADAAVRECLEETGYAIMIPDGRLVYEREQGFYHTREKAFYHSVQLFYIAELLSDTPDPSMISENDRKKRADWIELSELTSEETHPTVQELLETL